LISGVLDVERRSIDEMEKSGLSDKLRTEKK